MPAVAKNLTLGTWLEALVLIELRPDNHQPLQSSICTVQVVLNASTIT